MILSKFLPRTLRGLINEKSREWSPVFLPGTTLFADISGFTQLSEALNEMGREGAEYLTSTLNLYFSAIIDSIHRGGGDVMRFAGDAVTVFFPESAGEDAAIAVALDIQNYMRENPEAVSPVGNFPIRIKIGIASGTHTLMLVGEGETIDYVFAGEAVDGSAEAEHHAEPGDTILHPSCKASGGEFLKIPLEIPEEMNRSRADDTASLPDSFSAPFLHPALTDKLLSGHSHLLNEHRRTAILFVSFGGVSDYMNRTELTFLNTLYVEVRQLIDTFDGYINKVDMGDKGSKFLITFGVPVTHEDDGERAVRAAEELMALSKRHGISMGIGVNTGTIFAGILGSDARCEYTVMGDDVNLAARLMQMAGNDRLIVSASTKESAPSRLYSALPPTKVKGKSEPIAIFIPREEGVTRDTRAEHFVGRSEELRRAKSFIEKRGKQPAILSILGEAGAGKSAFFSHLREELDPSTLLLYGTCQPYTARFPYHPWKSLLHGALDRLEITGAHDPGRKWYLFLQDRYPDLLPFAALLPDLLGLPHSLPEVVADDETRKSVLQRLVMILLQSLAEEMEILMIMDNAQWMDDESVDLFRNLLRSIEAPSPLFVTLGRSELEGLTEMVSEETLTMGPLLEEEVSRFLISIFETERIPKRLLDEVIQASHGHPLLLQETLKTFEESGYVSRDEEHPEILHLDESLRPSMPATLEEVVMARFDRLTADEQALLKTFSVLGENIELDLSLRVLKRAGHKKEILTRLTDTGEFLLEDSATGNILFAQNHVRSTIYDSLNFKSRRSLHTLVAGEYEDYLSDDDPDKVQTLAFHYVEAQNYEEGKNYIFEAGKQAYGSYAFPTVTHYLKLLLDVEELLGPDSFAEAAYFLGDALIKMGKFPDVLSIYHDEFILQAPEGDTRSRLFKIAGDASRLTGNFPLASDNLDLALGEARSDSQRFRVLETRGTMFAQTSRFEEAMNLFTELIKDYSGKIPEDDIVRTATVRGPLHFVTGQREKGLSILKEAKEIFIQKGEINTAIRILNNLGNFFNYSSEHEASFDSFQESLKFQERFGISQYLTVTLNELGNESMLMGRWKDAHYYLNYGLSLFKRYNDPTVIRILCNYSELCQYAGFYTQAREHLVRARELADRFNIEGLWVSYYWTEYFVRLGIPGYLDRFLANLNRDIKNENASYLMLIRDAFEAYSLYLSGETSPASEMAEIVIDRAVQSSMKKEEFLGRRTLYFISSEKSERREHLDRLLALSEEIGLGYFQLNAVKLAMREDPSEELIARGDEIISGTPFCDLAWRFHALAAAYFETAAPKKVLSRVRKASAFYDHMKDHLPSASLREQIQKQKEAKLLTKLRSNHPFKRAASLPEIYSKIT